MTSDSLPKCSQHHSSERFRDDYLQPHSNWRHPFARRLCHSPTRIEQPTKTRTLRKYSHLRDLHSLGSDSDVFQLAEASRPKTPNLITNPKSTCRTTEGSHVHATPPLIPNPTSSHPHRSTRNREDQPPRTPDDHGLLRTWLSRLNRA